MDLFLKTTVNFVLIKIKYLHEILVLKFVIANDVILQYLLLQH